ncbi:bifunctional cytidylyltransferase/SDR family oxidoreductase [Nonomuraea sp. FMUSA5-5]|uniref:2-C-methyl-D-erythritol 4-phosphate cytidylyltransferase n=1 Tax=Nonomuraea composti TaxID=2720023 RepID=A0ABX1BEF6_9ACTN|nr:bifunctional cytidylyltransferase/SDR family oxidoreductase [Nonomuraea sp. FMUSA5-5]NJP93208.1 bifunctional cytidylyltransferase/SDR family oxidoreductase [Nonomuraea sp. FMUSA5-5]
MDSRLRSVGVLLAGGVGQRVGLGTPKQLIEVAGRTIIEHSLAVFEAAPEIDEIVVLMTPGYADRVREIVARGGYRKVSKVVDGGSSRTESTWRALAALGTDECNVLLHDAVRPLLEPRIITECVRALETHEAVNVAIPSSDTVLVATPEGAIGEVLDRSRLRRSQTPQCFRLSVIRRAYELAMADPGFAGLPATDDCGVVLRYLPEVPIHLVAGSERNIKVTHPADLHIADLLFRLPPPVPAGDRTALSGQVIVILAPGPRPGDLAPGTAPTPRPGHLAPGTAPTPRAGHLAPDAPSSSPEGPQPKYGGTVGGGGPVAEAAAHAATEVAAQAAAHGATVHVLTPGDGVRVEDFDSVAKALDDVGGADHVVLVAGTGHSGDLSRASGETVADAVAAGHLGALNVARAARPHLRRSLLLHVPPGSGALHESGAAAVAGLTRALAREWAADGIRVNCVNTGASPLVVAQTSLDILISDLSGQVIDARVDGA